MDIHVIDMALTKIFKLKKVSYMNITEVLRDQGASDEIFEESAVKMVAPRIKFFS